MPATESPAAVVCPACGKRYAYQAEWAGRQFACACGSAVAVPAATTFSAASGRAGAEMSAADLPASIPRKKKADDWPWWYYVAAGVGMVVLGVFEFSRLSDLDDGHVDSVRLQNWEAAIYSVLGKWGVLAALLAMAALAVGYGLYEFNLRRKTPQSTRR